MSKNSVVFRLLVGLVLLASFVLSGCAALSRAETVPEEPAEGGQGIFIDSVEALILESWPVQVQVVIRGNLADGCTVRDQIRIDRDEAGNRFEITIVTNRDEEAMCTMALVPFEETVSLDVEGLPAGSYTVEVHGVSTTFELAADNLPSDLPAEGAGDGLYIDSVDVVMPEGSPVQVVITGNLADGCTSIVDYLITHEEGTDLFEVIVGTYRDPDAMCTMALVPVEEQVGLGVEGLPAGTYRVEVNGVSTTFEWAGEN
jgi:hypothetical protein